MDTLQVDLAAELRAFRLGVSLNVGRQIVALVGPSGAGKSTVLRSIAGLFEPAAGRITLGDETWFSSEDGIDLAPERRRVGMVFQEYALFPHMTVAENVGFGGRERVDELLARLSISALGPARVTEISGGERQRVAVARALARDPGVLLLDEPLSALDTHTRAGIRTELGALLRELALPTIIVTHDFADAAALADDVAVISEGAIRQRGTPFDLMSAPVDPFVASFTGATIVDVVASEGELILPAGQRLAAAGTANGPYRLAVYPWEARASAHGIPATVTGLAPSGAAVRVDTDAFSVDVAAGAAPALGQTIGLELPEATYRLFPSA